MNDAAPTDLDGNPLPPERPGNALGLLLTIATLSAMWGPAVLIAAEAIDQREQSVLVGVAFVFLGALILAANKLAPVTWYFRLWVKLAENFGRPVRDRRILYPLGAGFILAGGMSVLFGIADDPAPKDDYGSATTRQ